MKKKKDKWCIIAELCDKLSPINRTHKPDEFGKDLKCITYAPNIGYRSWIFKYKGVYVALFDAGNDHYDFHTMVNYRDVIAAIIIRKLCDKYKKFGDWYFSKWRYDD